jgi:hypothetical protein
MYRLRWAVLILGLVLLAGGPTVGQEKKADKEDPKIKGAIPAHWKDLNLTADQKQKVYKVHADYKPKIDELEKKVKDLKAEEYAEKVKVLTDDQKKKLKDTVIPDDKAADAKATEGKFVSYKDGKLTISADGKDKEFAVKDVKPTIDGKDGKWDDIKKDAKVTVTETDGKVTKVEAKNP